MLWPIAMSVSLLTSLVLALSWTTNLGAILIRRGSKNEPADDADQIGKASSRKSRVV